MRRTFPTRADRRVSSRARATDSFWSRAGGQLVRVKPHNTSNLCSRCDALTPSTIGEDYRCHQCGMVMDRDVNAALNILRRGIMTAVTAAAKLPTS